MLSLVQVVLVLNLAYVGLERRRYRNKVAQVVENFSKRHVILAEHYNKENVKITGEFFKDILFVMATTDKKQHQEARENFKKKHHKYPLQGNVLYWYYRLVLMNNIDRNLASVFMILSYVWISALNSPWYKDGTVFFHELKYIWIWVWVGLNFCGVLVGVFVFCGQQAYKSICNRLEEYYSVWKDESIRDISQLK